MEGVCFQRLGYEVDHNPYSPPAFDELLEAQNRAIRGAEAAGRTLASIYDLLISLLEVQEVQQMISESGGDIRALRSTLSLAQLQPPEPLETSFLTRFWSLVADRGGVDSVFRRTIAAAHAMRFDGRRPRAVHVMIAACDLKDPGLSSLLDRARVSRLSMLRWHCHREKAGASPEAPDDPLLEVVVLNDDYTKVETVIEVLQKTCDLSAARALDLALVVHHKGGSVVGAYPREKAMQIVRDARELAGAAGAPLKLVLRAPASARAGAG